MADGAEVRALELAELTVDVVSAFVSNNALPVAGLSDLIASVYASFSGLSGPAVPPPVELIPAVNPKKSVFPDYIICLEDGKRFKSLKRHIRTDFNLSPEEYRAKWDLPRDYPMVAPAYAMKRSALAKASGLGRKAPAAPAKKPKSKT
jgi:predicted transcriptional regulator